MRDGATCRATDNVLLQINNISVPFSVLSVPMGTNRKLEMTQLCGKQQTLMLLITAVFFPPPIRDPFSLCLLEWVTTTSSNCFSCCTNASPQSTKDTFIQRRVRHPSRGWQISFSPGSGACESAWAPFSYPTDNGLDLLTPTLGFLHPNGAAALYSFLIHPLPLWP